MDHPTNLKTLREQKGFSVEALANEIGVSTTTVNSWETGDTAPPAQYLPKLATAFGVDQSEIDIGQTGARTG